MTRKLPVLRVVLLFIGAWVALVLLMTASIRLSGETGWPKASGRVLSDWGPWMVFSPLVFLLSFRFRLSTRRWYGNALIHVIASIALAFLAELLVQFVISPAFGLQPVPGPPGFDGPPPPTDFSPEAKFEGFPPPPPPGRSHPPLLPHRPPAPPDRQPTLEGIMRHLGQKSIFWVPLYWVLVSLCHVAIYRRESIAREKAGLELQRDLAQAQLTTLRLQLEPHFLFNALNAITTLVHEDPNRADKMIGHLSDLLRGFLDEGERELIPLREELRILDDYLAIEKVRFEDRLNLEKEIDESALSSLVPVMILQPIAENAIRHGIEQFSAGGTLRLEIRRLPEHLRVRVINFGRGPKREERKRERHNRRGGKGLTNTRARLEAAFGSKASLTLSSVENDEGFDGACVEIQVPLQSSAE